jgi:hypothetical protein
MFSFYFSGNIHTDRSPAAATPLPASAPGLRSARPALAGCGMGGAGVSQPVMEQSGDVDVGMRRPSSIHVIVFISLFPNPSTSLADAPQACNRQSAPAGGGCTWVRKGAKPVVGASKMMLAMGPWVYRTPSGSYGRDAAASRRLSFGRRGNT